MWIKCVKIKKNISLWTIIFYILNPFTSELFLWRLYITLKNLKCIVHINVWKIMTYYYNIIDDWKLEEWLFNTVICSSYDFE